MEKLSDIITSDCIRVPLKAADRFGAIEELVNILHAAGKIADTQPLLDAVVAREKTRTTGIGEGLAIPHGKCAGIEGLVASAGKPAQPIDFDSVDGQPVHFVVLFGSVAGQTSPHIRALSRLSKLMTRPSFRDAIGRAKTAKDVHRALVEHEENDSE